MTAAQTTATGLGNQLTTLKGIADDVQANALGVPSTISTVIQDINDFIDLFADTVARVVNPARLETVVNQFIQDMIDRLSDLVRNNIGPCGLLVASYDEMLAATCDDGQDSLDAYWFAMALVSFLAIILIILSIKVGEESHGCELDTNHYFSLDVVLQLSRYLTRFEYRVDKRPPKDSSANGPEDVRARDTFF